MSPLGIVIESPHQSQMTEVGEKEFPEGGNKRIRGKMAEHRKGCLFTCDAHLESQQSGNEACRLLSLHCSKFPLNGMKRLPMGEEIE